MVSSGFGARTWDEEQKTPVLALLFASFWERFFYYLAVIIIKNLENNVSKAAYRMLTKMVRTRCGFGALEFEN